MTFPVIQTTSVPRDTPGGLLVSNPYSLKHIRNLKTIQPCVTMAWVLPRPAVPV
jgi:hypothetical protein